MIVREPQTPEQAAAPALIDAASGARMSYADVWDRIRSHPLAREPRGLVFCRASNSVESIIDYLAALENGHAVALLDAALKPELTEALVARYTPDWVLGPESASEPAAGDAGTGERGPAGTGGAQQAGPAGDEDPEGAWMGLAVDRAQRGRLVANEGPRPPRDPRTQPRSPNPSDLHPDLALLLTTSGSTGSPKFVRLSGRAVAANAGQIVESLGITPADRAITSLPMHYSYGLSVINSHLAAGATVVVTPASVLDEDFWTAVERFGVTSIAGVPFTYQMLRRLNRPPESATSLRMLTQAGGRLAEDQVRHWHETLAARGIAFVPMYGQTEAAPRIASTPLDRLGAKPGSPGVAMPGGELRVRDGEIVYRGPNVMLGYAESRADLAKGDELHGELATGDLGHVDDEGFLVITGRSKRIAKIYGSRVSLDEVEGLLAGAGLGHVAVVGGEDVLHLCHDADADAAAARKELAATLKVPVATIKTHHVAELPRLATGKIDYAALAREVRA